MGCLTHTLIMEGSSPLASMKASSFGGTCGSQADTLVSFGSGAMLAPPNFNFKDLSMMQKKTISASSSDYFSSKPMRGSSPTASLAADLSQNFHIDQSPVLPTPRRSLFPTRSNLFTGTSGTPTITTPPILSSSPGFDGMDISPLPHKLPFGVIHLQSPTPELTPSTDSSILYSAPTSASMLEPPSFGFPHGKKRGPARPGLARVKGLSTGDIHRRPSVESQPPRFQFGNGISQQSSTPFLPLSEAFEESPPSEKSLLRNLSSMAPPRNKSLSGVIPNMRGGGGSPVSNHLRKMSNPHVRPRKLCRRSLSMFGTQEEVQVALTHNLSPALASIRDVEPHVPELPHFASDEKGDLPRITADTMIDVLDGKYNHIHDRVVVIDCRFDYEYDAGHINGAINFTDPEKLAEHLFDSTSATSTSKALIIFHCEFSRCRAPGMARFFRSHDRSLDTLRYPVLTYPEAYILDGGYCAFFETHPSRCFPQAYVQMKAEGHADACEKGMGKVKKQRMPKLARAQTFAEFSHGSSPLGASPIAPRILNRHASDTIWRPTALSRAEFRGQSESTMGATNISNDTNMNLSDSDVEMDLSNDFPPVTQSSSRRPSLLFDRRFVSDFP